VSRSLEPRRQNSIPDFLWTGDEPLVERGVAEHPGSASSRTIPGEVGLWVFVLGDMSVFGLFFLVFMFEGRRNPELFAAGAGSLVQAMGFGNTLVLLFSSWLVVLAVHAHRLERHALALREVAGALLCAVIFGIVKAFEYAHELEAGHRPSSDLFFTFYFVLTGIHLVHVIVGSGLLTGWVAKARARRPWNLSRRYVEAAAVYWHMVDLLWVVIFTLVYLVHDPLVRP
jgi:nitric oxide reductase NorE protein